MQTLIRYIGDDPEREGLLETPERVLKAYGDLYGGYGVEPANVLKTFSAEGYDDMILVKDIEYYSACEHHMALFYGRAHVAYIPGEKITGLSKLPRIVETYARRLQNQERITTQIADAIAENLSPKGVAVMLTGVHTCMCARGVKSRAETVTFAYRGEFRGDDDLVERFEGLVG